MATSTPLHDTSVPTVSPSSSPPPSSTTHPSPSGSPTLVDGAKTIYAQDLMHVHQMPCARSAFLFGLGAGFGVGGLHFILRTTRRRSVGGSEPLSRVTWKSMNWFVGSWALGSAGAFQFCQRRRELEQKSIGRARELMDRKRKEKEEEMRRARDLVRRAREDEQRAEEQRRKSWWGLGRWLLPQAQARSSRDIVREGTNSGKKNNDASLSSEPEPDSTATSSPASSSGE